ncbi:MAG: glycosyltransferase family 4 protein [Gemmataceae bacterium]
MNLLLFNLVTDLDHPILGFTSHWIRELAARVDSVEVITMRRGRVQAPENVRVHSVGAERGYSEPRRVFEFYRILSGILGRGRIDGCFAHMAPEFAILAGPVLRAKRIPLVTWYAHPSLHWRVKLAHVFSHQMVASLPNAYPWKKDKLTVIGQGIDTTLFAPDGTPEENDLVLCVGRVSAVKDHATLLRAAALLRRPARVVVLGQTAGPEDEAYLLDLGRLAAELGIAVRVTFAKGVPPAELPSWYRRCAAHVNLTPAGFGDKVAWEAMACARPCLVANVDFAPTLGRFENDLLFRVHDVADLAAKLDNVLAQSAEQRAAMGQYLRGQVERWHSLPRLAEQVLEQLRRFAPCGAATRRRVSRAARLAMEGNHG